IDIDSPVDCARAPRPAGENDAWNKGLIALICVSGISAKSKLPQRLIGVEGEVGSCLAAMEDYSTKPTRQRVRVSAGRSRRSTWAAVRGRWANGYRREDRPRADWMH